MALDTFFCVALTRVSFQVEMLESNVMRAKWSSLWRSFRMAVKAMRVCTIDTLRWAAVLRVEARRGVVETVSPAWSSVRALSHSGRSQTPHSLGPWADWVARRSARSGHWQSGKGKGFKYCTNQSQWEPSNYWLLVCNICLAWSQ